jgi:CDP-4-dehydro-6-deoxyglucose reductase
VKAVLRDWTELAPGVRDFEFEVPEVDRLAYAAGQFVSFSADVGGKWITRAYSVSSPPAGNRFHLCLNLVPDGHLSPLLFGADRGWSVDMQGPLGTFTIRDRDRDMVMVATGTGVAPFRAMIEEHLESGVGRGRITLLLGVRYEANLLYRGRFEELARQHDGFRFVPVLSRPGADWRGRTGHVQPHLLEIVGDRRDLHVYACGMKAMVDDVRARLREIGFDRRQIIVEKYD